MRRRSIPVWACLALALISPAMSARAAEAPFDVVIRGGVVYDGSGKPGLAADVGLRSDRIAAVGNLSKAQARTVVDAKGLAIAPGFINMLSWAVDSLIADGRSQGDIRQGVTTEIFGEGSSMGPLTDEMKRLAKQSQGDIQYDITWTTLAEYLAFLEKKGIAPNVASYIGAATLREHVLGEKDVKPTPEQMEAMRALVREGMAAGRARHRLVADLRAGQLRLHGGADRAVQGSGAVPGQVHLPHAQRRRRFCSRPSTSWSASAAKPACRRRSIT